MGPLVPVLALMIFTSTPAHAQDTIALYGDTGSGLSRSINAALTPFEVVVLMKPEAQSSAAEFVMTELILMFPGMFKLSITKVNNTAIDLGDNSLGEYMLAFGDCVEAGQVELVRVQYLDMGGAIPPGAVL